MSRNFFEIASPRDMLEKAKRELERMKADINTDTVFNFFVTAYHIMDYVKQQGAVSAATTDAMYHDADFGMCQFICNKGKHLVLRKDDKDTETVRNPGALFGAFTFGSTMFNEGPSYKFFVDGQEVNLAELGDRLIAKWEAFFNSNGI